MLFVNRLCDNQGKTKYLILIYSLLDYLLLLRTGKGSSLQHCYHCHLFHAVPTFLYIASCSRGLTIQSYSIPRVSNKIRPKNMVRNKRTSPWMRLSSIWSFCRINDVNLESSTCRSTYIKYIYNIYIYFKNKYILLDLTPHPGFHSPPGRHGIFSRESLENLCLPLLLDGA